MHQKSRTNFHKNVKQPGHQVPLNKDLKLTGLELLLTSSKWSTYLKCIDGSDYGIWLNVMLLVSQLVTVLKYAVQINATWLSGAAQGLPAGNRADEASGRETLEERPQRRAGRDGGDGSARPERTPAARRRHQEETNLLPFRLHTGWKTMNSLRIQVTEIKHKTTEKSATQKSVFPLILYVTNMRVFS